MAFGFDPKIAQTITQAAQRYGVSPQTMMAIAQIESRGNPAAKNPNSSAAGLFQFINSTAKQYGLSNPYDAAANADAGARFARDNTAILQKTLGRAPTTGELYLAHQQGAGGARKLLSNPNARAVDIVGAQAVKLNGGHAGMSAQEFANIWINKAMKTAGKATVPAPSTSGLSMGETGPAPLPTGPYGLSMGVSDVPVDQPEVTQAERMSQVGASLMALDRGEPMPIYQQAQNQPDMRHVFSKLTPLMDIYKKGMGF